MVVVTKLGKLSVCIGIVLLVAGCSSKPVHAGSAATIGTTVIKQQTVTTQLNEIVAETKNTPAGMQITDPGTIGQKIVNRLIIANIVDQALVQIGKKVTSSEVAKFRDQVFLQYGKESVEQQLATSQGVPKSEIDSFFRTILGQGYIGSAVMPTGTDQERSQATGNFLIQLASKTDIKVSPRYGVWNPAQLQATGFDNSMSFAPPATNQ